MLGPFSSEKADFSAEVSGENGAARRMSLSSVGTC